MNDNIRFPKMQVITDDGQNVGILTKREAIELAENAGLDLVLLSEEGNQGVPVAKIMNFGKALYEKKKKQNEAKKHQKTIQIKEIKLRPKIGDHDLQTKMNRAYEFLTEGKHLKVTIAFRGREIVTKEERGQEMFDRIESMMRDNGFTNLVQEKDAKAGPLWSKIYYMKSAKK